jgi:hypothetical protein
MSWFRHDCVVLRCKQFSCKILHQQQPISGIWLENLYPQWLPGNMLTLWTNWRMEGKSLDGTVFHHTHASHNTERANSLLHTATLDALSCTSRRPRWEKQLYKLQTRSRATIIFVISDYSSLRKIMQLVTTPLPSAASVSRARTTGKAGRSADGRQLQRQVGKFLPILLAVLSNVSWLW